MSKRQAWQSWNATNGYSAMRDAPTPAVLVDVEIFDENLAAAAGLFRGSGKQLRPHVKTHRASFFALRQLGAVTSGVTCATVGEAETMVHSGVDDVLLANEIVTPFKIDRVVALSSAAHVTVAVDAVEPARQLSAAAERAGRTVDVLVDVDVGLERCGVSTPNEAVSLARLISDCPGLRLAGIMGYEGRIRSTDTRGLERITGAFGALAEIKTVLESAGFEISTVSAAGTATLLPALGSDIVTEIQAGTYAFMEQDLEGLQLPFRCCVSVLATVISSSSMRVIVDAGRKTIGCEYGLPIALDPLLETVAVSEEHVVLTHSGGAAPHVGDQVVLRPTQVRTTFNLHDVVWLHKDGELIGQVPVDARGRSQ